MSITRLEIEYYKNIGRIATALEKLVAQGEHGRLDQFKHATNLIYGNSKFPSPLKNNPGKGRSEDDYTYPEFVKKHYNKDESKSDLSSFQPNIESDLDARIHKESQAITGGEFPGWYSKLTEQEKQSYAKVYKFQ